MTGGGGGLHRGRMTGNPGGAHWWGGTGPTGGGTHAAPGRRRRGLVALVALLAVLLAGGGVVTLVATRGTDPAPPATASPAAGPAGPDGPAPAAATSAGHPGARTERSPDAAVLQSTIDDVLATSPLRFPADTATPEAATAGAVERLAAVLRATPGPPVVVEGHTAPAGEITDDAQRLSQERAQEIARRLEAAGVPTGRLTAVGVGPDRPLATLEASRRVELRVG